MKRSAFISLVAAAALALTATTGAATASASGAFNSTAYPLITKGEGATAPVWKLGAAKLRCGYAQATGKLASSLPELAQSMTFVNCTLGGLVAQFNMNGCTFNDYVLSAGGGSDTGGRAITCPAGKQIEVTTWNSCVIQIPPQSHPGTVSYTNKKLIGRDVIDVVSSLSGLKYTGSASCAAEHIGARENGEISSSWTVSAYSTGGTESTWLDFWIQ